MALNAQTGDQENMATKLSGTGAPGQAWDDWFNQQVALYEKSHAGERTMTIARQIPVVFHIIHYGQAVGAYPNIDSSEITTQMRTLNADYAGVGMNYTNVPVAFANLIANTGITFCLAKKNPSGTPLAEAGIHRFDANSAGWQDPSTPTVNLVNYINTTVKAATIWDPNKYLNIWVSDRSPSTTILGFATYPAGTTLVGIPPGVGTSTNDGVWCYAKAVGNTGAAIVPPYNGGRTLTREIAHWLGVRSLWGDGNCLDDYCGDTPWQKQANTGAPIHPSFVNTCGPGTSPNGEMTMNFMDFTDDSCRYMFTPKQATRMQTAMSQGTYRVLLGTHTLCTLPVVTNTPAVAGFFVDAVPCVGQPFTPGNTSSGGPLPTFQWSSAPAAVIYPSPAVANPAITFNSPGSYTLYLTATNSLNISTYSLVIPSVTTCPIAPLCLDTVSPIQSNDTLTTYRASNSNFVLGCQSGFSGYLTGTNCYSDKEFAQFIAASSYSAIYAPQVNSMIVLFDSVGTKLTNPGTMITCKLYSGTLGNGPNSPLTSETDSLKSIIKSPKYKSVSYCGISTFTTTRIIPYKFDFPQPFILTLGNTAGFYASVETPYTSVGDSINIFSNTQYTATNDSSSWVLLSSTNNWRTIRYGKGTKLQLAMIPQLTCRPLVGIREIQSELAANVAVVPNPNNGVFSLIFTLPREEKLTITAFNTLGQQVVSEQLENVTHNVVNMDLNSRPAGIYFIHVSNGTDQTVKKVVVTH